LKSGSVERDGVDHHSRGADNVILGQVVTTVQRRRATYICCDFGRRPGDVRGRADVAGLREGML